MKPCGQKLNLSFSAPFVEKSSFFLAIDPEDIIFSAQLVDLNFFFCDVIENRRFEIEKMSKMASDLTVELFFGALTLCLQSLRLGLFLCIYSSRRC